MRSDLESWVSVEDNIQHVVYIGNDHVLYELWLKLGGSGAWNKNPLNTDAGAPPPALGSALTSWVSVEDNIQHVVYIGNDDVLYELWLKLGGSGAWNKNPLNTDAGAPAPYLPPAVETLSAVNVGTSTATLRGTVNPEGNATSYHFEYDYSAAYNNVQIAPKPDGSVGSGTSPVAVECDISNLSDGVTLHFRLVAITAGDTVYGGDVTLQTKKAAFPVPTTGAATNITETSATLAGSINPEGEYTDFVFEYGETSAYGSQTPLRGVGSGMSAVDVEFPISGLKSGTTYHYKLDAIQVGGQNATGADATFTTVGTAKTGTYGLALAEEAPQSFDYSGGPISDWTIPTNAVITTVKNTSNYNYSLARGGPGATYINLNAGSETDEWNGLLLQQDTWSAQFIGKAVDLPKQLIADVSWKT
jgi:hypothetical protein